MVALGDATSIPQAEQLRRLVGDHLHGPFQGHQLAATDHVAHQFGRFDQGRIDCRFGRPQLGRDLLRNKHLIHDQIPFNPKE